MHALGIIIVGAYFSLGHDVTQKIVLKILRESCRFYCGI